MDVIITIEDKQDNYKEVVREKNIINRKHFSYADSLGVLNDVRIFNNGITIFRKDEDHETFVVLRDKPYIKVKSSEGSIVFSIKEPHTGQISPSITLEISATISALMSPGLAFIK